MTTQGATSALQGVARVGPRTKDLVARLQPGEITVIDHVDLDRVAAESLRDAGVRAVVNAQLSMTGRYPNTGPLLLATAGITIVDSCGETLLERVPDGVSILLVDGQVRRDLVVAPRRRHERGWIGLHPPLPPQESSEAPER